MVGGAAIKTSAPVKVWEPMTLSPVGRLGDIMQGAIGTKNDGGGVKAKA